jgi:anti-sigma regulatory factor (Ser/Thr protein kinase)/DNA-binding NarL/FixJ family response regulator
MSDQLSPFQILWVEDRIELFKPGLQGLHQDKDKLTGIPGRPIRVRNARTRKEADQSIAEAPPGGYDLVLLDWKYPMDEGQPEEYLGLKWLPVLREEQPLACIAVLSSWATDFNLGPAVAALRDDGADEVIPKGIDWDETVERLRRAIAHRSIRNGLAQTTKPYLSKVARVTAEDLQLAVGRARADLQAAGTGDPARRASQILEGLAREVERIGKRLPGKVKAELEDVDCVMLAKEVAAGHVGQIRHPIPVAAEESCIVRTYREEIRDALNEIVQNAVDSMNEAETFPTAPAVRVDIRKSDLEDLGKCVEIAVSDKGMGFHARAWASRCRPDNLHWTRERDRHKGMGLYVTHRMMMAVGGRVELESTKDGSKVTLIVRDWS